MELTEVLQKVTQFPLALPHLHHILVLCLLVFVIFKIKSLIFQRQKWLRAFSSFPGPPHHWFFGHINEFKQDGADLGKILKWGEQYHYAFQMWFGPFIVMINLQDPDYVKSLLATTEPKDNFGYRFLMPWIGDGLLLSEGQKWFRHRRLLTPGFHYNILKPYVKLMSDSAITMLDNWEGYAKTNQPFELFEHVSLMTLDNIMKCAFSSNSNCQTNGGTNTYIKAVYELTELLNLRITVFPYHSDIIFYLSPHGFRFRRASRVSKRHTEEVIRKRKEVLKDEKEQDKSQAKRNLDFLDILLCARDENQQGLSDKDIQAEVDTFMFEGHDTTASGISFLLYCLACYPKHQQICREEILQALQGKTCIEWEDLSKIPYTTMCIKESLRLYPPVPGIARQLTKPITFSDGRSLPEGSIIVTNVFGIHRNASVWENPNEFDPLRFLPENISKRSTHAFVPFSAGPRNCIGQNFAMNEIKVVIMQTLRRYQLIEDPTRKPKLISRLVLRSLNGVHIKIKPVDPPA